MEDSKRMGRGFLVRQTLNDISMIYLSGLIKSISGS
jgi:hypothetical protein